MIKSNVGHLVFHIDMKNSSFYKELFSFLGWAVWFDDPGMLGLGNDKGTSLWFGESIKKDVSNDYDGPGVNHVAISVENKADVDATVAYLTDHGTAALFETPRHRPEFSGGPEKTYYQVMFESPDRILFEVVYAGPVS
jgi:catechol 2,3-dioxygenase-like lactoylglutathione lyase family enzyme